MLVLSLVLANCIKLHYVLAYTLTHRVSIKIFMTNVALISRLLIYFIETGRKNAVNR